jgi:hypothetical protein
LHAARRGEPKWVPDGARRPSWLGFRSLPLVPEDRLSADTDGLTAARAADAWPWLRGCEGSGVASGRPEALCASARKGACGCGCALLRRLCELYFFAMVYAERGRQGPRHTQVRAARAARVRGARASTAHASPVPVQTRQRVSR